MADWSKPALASKYDNFVTETNARDADLAVMFDPAVVTPTNIPTNTIRWRDAANKWEKWNGTAWSDLAATYAINISGTAANVTGVVDEANGGTGQSSYTIGDLLYASGAAALSKLAAVATGNVLLSGGAATAPTWGKVGLTTHVSGTLPVANGGTGAGTLTGVAYGNGTGAFTAATAAQLVAAIGATAVSSADTLDGYHATSFVRTVNGSAPDGSGNVAVASGVTPSQFDSDTSLATTAFVQRALGSFSGHSQYNTSTTLTASDVGKLTISGGGGGVFTLPLTSTLAVGAKITLLMQGGSSSVVPQGTDVLYLTSGSVTSVGFVGGEWIELTCANSAWIVSGGSTLSSIGCGQTWQSQTRANGTVYTNTTRKPIMVVMNVSQGVNTTSVLYVNGVGVATYSTGAAYTNTAYFTAIVPCGATYQTANCTINSAMELR